MGPDPGFPNILSEHKWFNQVQKLGFRPAMGLLFQGFEGGLKSDFDLRESHFLLPEQLAHAMADGNVPSLFDKLAATRSEGAMVLVFAFLLKTLSVEGLKVATQSLVGSETIRRQRQRSVQDMIHTNEPHSTDGMSYELRRHLFALTVSPDKDQAAFAVDYLTHVNSLRQESASINVKPKHPDTQSDRPWPHIAPRD